MKFTDEDLKRLKDDIQGREKEDLVLDVRQARALLARLECAEEVCASTANGSCAPDWMRFKAWRESKGEIE